MRAAEEVEKKIPSGKSGCKYRYNIRRRGGSFLGIIPGGFHHGVSHVSHFYSPMDC